MCLVWLGHPLAAPFKGLFFDFSDQRIRGAKMGPADQVSPPDGMLATLYLQD